MTAFATFALPNDATKLRFKEPFVTEALNLKGAGLVPPGIYRGFTASPQPGYLLNFNVDGTNLDSVAVVETTQHYNMTVRSNSQITVDMTGQVVFPVYAVLRTEYGITPSPLAGFTFSNVLIVNPALNNADPQSLHTGDIKLCRILGFIGTTPNISIAPSTDRQDNGGPLVTRALLASVSNALSGVVLTSGDITSSGAVIPIPGTQLMFNSIAGQIHVSYTMNWRFVGGGNDDKLVTQTGIQLDGVPYVLSRLDLEASGGSSDHLTRLPNSGSIILPVAAGPHLLELIGSSAGSSGGWQIQANPTLPLTMSLLYPAVL